MIRKKLHYDKLKLPITIPIIFRPYGAGKRTAAMNRAVAHALHIPFYIQVNTGEKITVPPVTDTYYSPAMPEIGRCSGIKGNDRLLGRFVPKTRDPQDIK